MRTGILAILALAFTAAPSMSAPDVVTYRNDRFGTTASFPAEAFPIAVPAPVESDGFAWRSDEGAEIFIYGRRNDDRETPRSVVEWRSSNDDVTYRRSGADWAVVSGHTRDGRIFYERYEFRGSVIHSVAMRYPYDLRIVYDGIVGDVAGTLSGPSR